LLEEPTSDSASTIPKKTKTIELIPPSPPPEQSKTKAAEFTVEKKPLKPILPSPPPPKTRTEEFAEPGTYKKLPCQGRACAKCHKCRDWSFKGDKKTWDWLANCNNWNDSDRKRYCDNEMYSYSK